MFKCMIINVQVRTVLPSKCACSTDGSTLLLPSASGHLFLLLFVRFCEFILGKNLANARSLTISHFHCSHSSFTKYAPPPPCWQVSSSCWILVTAPVQFAVVSNSSKLTLPSVPHRARSECPDLV